MEKRWLKWFDLENGEIKFAFTSREADEDDAPGEDVGRYFHPEAVQRAERTGKCLSLEECDQDFAQAGRSLP